MRRDVTSSAVSGTEDWLLKVEALVPRGWYQFTSTLWGSRAYARRTRSQFYGRAGVIDHLKRKGGAS